ncbi:MAG: mannose-1-phosphate guanylyltransferase [Candidatus Auribacter fodinae]|jgi:mannose-1-phosphate guanylyltransferase|uniref:mannose-1-phosphate guanylyltransferase n=1 Tax=Candidatus Auribacter fodinae TaxID=2093366 RepID=A0A3A4R8D1_9BACT|nr:MAG: mannose-1-phosphate guanylyltransferase [Candidatus Auribacter fodinae]
MIYAVIMAGGKGERFWPLSRLKTPKQLLAITSERTMIQETVGRISEYIPVDNILIITNIAQKAVIEQQLPHIPASRIIAEPCGRNTAPCIALAAAVISSESPNAVMLVLPADHIIHDREKFSATIKDTIEQAQTEKALFTIGIHPEHPATGYGYIHAGESVQLDCDTKFYVVKEFMEKPDLPTAQKFLASGEYFWNSGIFVWRTDVIVDCIKNFMPDLYDGYLKMRQSALSGDLDSLLPVIYPTLPSISVDYGIMEKAKKVMMAKSRFDWDDVGAWDAVAKHFTPDNDNNVINGRFLGIDTSGCTVFSKRHFVGTIGVENLIIVVTDDAVLVCNKDNAQDVKLLVQNIAKSKDMEYLL